MMGALQTGAGHGNARRRAPETKDSSGMTIIIQRVVKATPEVHDLIGELNEVLGADYEAINGMAFQSSNCSSRMCAFSSPV